MAIHQRMVMMILAFMCQSACTEGLSIQNCAKEKVAEINLDDPDVNKTLFTCDGIRENAQVKWQLKTKKRKIVPAGDCPPFKDTVKSCNTTSSNLHDIVFPKRTSSGSTMTILVRSAEDTLKNATLICKAKEGTQKKSSKCKLDLIRPASGTCNAVLVTESSPPWSVHVRCNITRGYSTRGRYHCLLSQESPRKREVKDIKMNNTDHLDQGGTAVCDRKFRVNTTVDTGLHRYSVQLIPGRTNVTVQGNIAVERPKEPPIIKCQPNLDEGMVPENQTLRCQCQAYSLGKPQGVLKWSRKHNNTGSFVVLNEGEEGQSNLSFSATLTRYNHTTRLQCGVQWGKEFIKTRPNKKIRVGYPASQVKLDINSGNPVVEESRATFKCWATDGRPSPSLTLRRGSGAELRTGQANLTYRWKDVGCKDSGNYTCTASNGMGPNKTVTSWLNVTCGPQGFSEQIPPFLYQDEEIQYTFDLIANPPPFKVTFLFLGSSEANSTSKVKDIVLSGRCEQKSETLVHANCIITLSNVTSSEAAGLYRGTLTNGQGSLDFIFEVKLNATMGPESSLDVVLVAAAGGGGVAALVVILVVVVIVRRRAKKGSNETMTLRDTDNVQYSLAAAAANSSDGGDSSKVGKHRLASSTMDQPLLAAEDPDTLYANVGEEDAAAMAGTTAKLPPMEVCYAVVQKKARPAPDLGLCHRGPDSRGPAAKEAKENVYAVVDKTRKRPERQQEEEEKEADSGGTVDSKADHSPESTTEDHVYGNINALNPMPDSGAQDNADSLAPESADTGREVNADGLLYVSMDFSNRQVATFRPPPPPAEGEVVYGAVDFSRTAPAQ